MSQLLAPPALLICATFCEYNNTESSPTMLGKAGEYKARKLFRSFRILGPLLSIRLQLTHKFSVRLRSGNWEDKIKSLILLSLNRFV